VAGNVGRGPHCTSASTSGPGVPDSLHVGDDHVRLLLVLVAADDVLVGHFFLADRAEAPVLDPPEILIVKLMEPHGSGLGGTEHLDRDGDETERHGPLPRDSHSVPPASRSRARRIPAVEPTWSTLAPIVPAESSVDARSVVLHSVGFLPYGSGAVHRREGVVRD